MAPSLALKAIGVLAALCVLALAYAYQPELPRADDYSTVAKVMAGIFVILGSVLFSAAIGRTFLKNGGRSAFKALYIASCSCAGLGAAEATSCLLPTNMEAALCVTTLLWIIAGGWSARFVSTGGA